MSGSRPKMPDFPRGSVIPRASGVPPRTHVRAVRGWARPWNLRAMEAWLVSRFPPESREMQRRSSPMVRNGSKRASKAGILSWHKLELRGHPASRSFRNTPVQMVQSARMGGKGIWGPTVAGGPEAREGVPSEPPDDGLEGAVTMRVEVSGSAGPMAAERELKALEGRHEGVDALRQRGLVGQGSETVAVDAFVVWT